MNYRLSLLSAALVLASAPASADIVHLDDVIIDGSLCVGFDCVNGEAFGFDTIRLKENNVRIKFQDTSSSASFPTNDWQLTANDSSNGGANKFSIDDIDGGRTPFTIEASAPSHSLYVDDGGRIGFGTNSPVVDLHVVSGNTPTLRLAQDGSSGFQAQTWDVAGNETNFFIRDATNGSTLPFRIKPGADTNALYIDSNGNIGNLAGTSPGAALHIKRSDASAHILIEDTSAASLATEDMITMRNNGPSRILYENLDSGITWKTNTTGGNRFEISQTGAPGTSEFVLEVNGSQLYAGIGNNNPVHVIDTWTGAYLSTGGVWTNASSRDLKKNIKLLEAEDALRTIREMEPVTYQYKSEENEQYVGFIAEDVPEIVATSDRKSLSPMDIVAVLTKAVKEQDRTINLLQKRVEELETTR